MKIDIVTLFPEMFQGPFQNSIIKRAIDKNIVEISIHNLRNWGLGTYKKVDDTPYSGGGGMLIMLEPVYKCLKAIKSTQANSEPTYVVAMTAKGNTLKQSKVKSLKSKKHLIILAGHYEGFDQRILDHLVDEQISIGDYVLTGGEIPAMVLTDTVIRLLPEVVGNQDTPKTDSFYQDDETIQYPQYTKPEEFKTEDNQIWRVPEILLSGNHERINNWKAKEAKKRTDLKNSKQK